MYIAIEKNVFCPRLYLDQLTLELMSISTSPNCEKYLNKFDLVISVEIFLRPFYVQLLS